MVLTGPDLIPRDVTVVKKGERGVVEYGPVFSPGLYTLAPPTGTPLHYVFNADRKESDLTRLSESEVNEMAKAHGVSVVRSFSEYKQLDHTQRFGAELWKWALWALLGMIFLELFLQQYFARVRGKL